MESKKTKECQKFKVGLLIWLLLFGFVNIIKSEPVDLEKAKAVALTQLNKVTKGVSLRSATSLNLVYEPKSETNQPYFYVFNGNGGFVIVSGDDRAEPILGYSEDGYFDPDNIPPNMAWFLEGYEKSIDNAIKNEIKSSYDIQKKWEGLRSNAIELRSYTSGSYLVKSRWGQAEPYNLFCPMDGIFQSVSGCVAIAMSQIIRYWGADISIAPNNGFGSVGSVNFEEAFYNYSKMPVSINNESDTANINQVAQLVYHCGVASRMQYGAHGSGATLENATIALRNNFGYSEARLSGEGVFGTISFDQLKNTLITEISKQQPVIYAGTGSNPHAWICDGYNSSDQFHMNWGYGSSHGWFLLTPLKCPDTGYDYSYENGVAIIYNIYPILGVKEISESYSNRPIIFVTPEGTGLRDGSSWENATSDLYGVVQANEDKQIWVKKGIYYGNTSTGSNSAAFIMGEKNRVYGGFEGYEESIEERKLINPSILDGQNVRRVLYQTLDYSLAEISIWDGFTIRNGADTIAGASNIKILSDGPIVSGTDVTGNGGGVYLRKNSVLINCIIENCKAISGGGVFNNGGKVINCSFYNNRAKNAGALYNSIDGIVKLTNSIIDNNVSADNTQNFGGGIFNSGQLYINELTEITNNRGHSGGGIYSNGTITMSSGIISNNIGSSGAGIYSDGDIIMDGGIISNNNAYNFGGGITLNSKGNDIRICKLNAGYIINNTASELGGGIMCQRARIELNGSIKIQGNSANGPFGKGGGIYVSNGYLNFTSGFIGIDTVDHPQSVEEAILSGGNYAAEGGGLFIDYNAGSVSYNNIENQNVIIGGNYALRGGGIYYNKIEFSELKECLNICGNTAEYYGGGVYNYHGVILNGCIISYNGALKGGGVYSQALSQYSNRYLQIIGQTSINNNLAQEGGGVYNCGTSYNFEFQYPTFYMSGGEIYNNSALKGSGIYNYSDGSNVISDSAKIKDIVYFDDYKTGMGLASCYLQPINLTYHVNALNQIKVEFKKITGSIIAKYNTPEETAAAVNNEVYAITSNYNLRPVADGIYVNVEQYTPIPTVKNVIYVTPEGAGKKDGTSWANATDNLYGEMLKDRIDSMQIWVRSGTYYGNTSVGQGGNNAAFILGKRNKVYGGFIGNESSLSERPGYALSILDGQNSRRVLCQLTDFSLADSSLVEGFKIINGTDLIAGTANIEISGTTHNGGTDMAGNGGGVYLRSNGILRNCSVENCKAISGGGVFNYNGKVIDCSFLYNEAVHAGGLFNRGYASLSNCTVRANYATRKSGTLGLGYGGGIYNMSTMFIHNGTLITENQGSVGNGLYTHSSGNTTMNGGMISRNIGGYSGGGIFSDGIVIINNGDIVYNQASQGGGIVSHGTLHLYSCNISNNNSGAGAGILSGGNLYIYSTSVKIRSNWSTGVGGGIFISNGYADIRGVTIGYDTDIAPSNPQESFSLGGNVSMNREGGGGIYASEGTTNFIYATDSIVIGGNYSAYDGGGIYTRLPMKLGSKVKIRGNTAANNGGGFYGANTNSTFELDGCEISYNKAELQGGGVYQFGSLKIFNNTVISYNNAFDRGGAVYSSKLLYMYDGSITGNSASVGGGIYNSGNMYIFGGVISGNAENAVFNMSKLEVSGSAKILDPIGISSSDSPIEIGELSYHKDSKHPIKIQAIDETTVALSGRAKDLLIKKIVISDVPESTLKLLDNDKIKMTSILNSSILNDYDSTEELSVYPTLISSGGELTIESPDGGNASILNMSGIIVGQHKLQIGKTKIAVSYPSGNYVVKIKTNTGEEKVVKIIVK